MSKKNSRKRKTSCYTPTTRHENVTDFPHLYNTKAYWLLWYGISTPRNQKLSLHSYYCKYPIAPKSTLKLYQRNHMIENNEGFMNEEKTNVPDTSYKNAKVCFAIAKSNTDDTTTKTETDSKHNTGVVRNLVSVIKTILRRSFHGANTTGKPFVLSPAIFGFLKQLWICVKRDSHPEAVFFSAKRNGKVCPNLLWRYYQRNDTLSTLILELAPASPGWMRYHNLCNIRLAKSILRQTFSTKVEGPSNPWDPWVDFIVQIGSST